MTSYISNIDYPNIGNSQKLKITFNNLRMDTSFVNAIRRILIAEIKTYSLAGDINIKTNTTKGFFKNNELIQHIISKVPFFINSDNNKLLNKDPRFIISDPNNINKPLINVNNEDLVIHAYDLKIIDPNDQPINYPIQNIVLHNISLLKLRKGEQFHMEVRPKESIGRNNYANWKNSRVSYKIESYVSLGLKKSTSNIVNPITGIITETNEEKKDYPINKYNQPTHITIQIDSLHHHDNDTSFIMALDLLENKLLTLRNMIENPNSNQLSSVKISYDDNVPHLLIFTITDNLNDDDKDFFHNNPLATDTLANLITSHILFNIIDIFDGETPEVINSKLRHIFSAYRIPHPENPIIEIRCKIPPEILPKHINQHISGDFSPSYKMLLYTLEQIATLANNVKTQFITLI